MTITELLDSVDQKYRTDAQILLAHLLKIDRSQLFAHPERELTSAELAKIQPLLQKLQTSYPLAYLLGQKSFYGRDFIVTPDVLIPRPETETIIDELLKLEQTFTLQDGEFIQLVDVGTGSGVIPITADLEFTHPVSTIGLDISPGALKIAEQNADRLGTQTRFFESDLLEVFDQGIPEVGPIIITANLPYVDRDWDWTSENLKFEPEIALYAENHGLKLIFDLIDDINRKVPEGYLLLEADPSQHQAIKTYLENANLRLMHTNDFILVVEI